MVGNTLVSLKLPHFSADIVLLALDAYNHIWINSNCLEYYLNICYTINSTKEPVAVENKGKEISNVDIANIKQGNHRMRSICWKYMSKTILC